MGDGECVRNICVCAGLCVDSNAINAHTHAHISHTHLTHLPFLTHSPSPISHTLLTHLAAGESKRWWQVAEASGRSGRGVQHRKDGYHKEPAQRLRARVCVGAGAFGRNGRCGMRNGSLKSKERWRHCAYRGQSHGKEGAGLQRW